MRVLVADHEPASARSIEHYARSRGHSVELILPEEAPSEALARTRAELAFLDLQLAKAEGALRILRGFPATSVVLLASRPTIEEAGEFGRSGALDYRSKPIEVDQLGPIFEAADARARRLLRGVEDVFPGESDAARSIREVVTQAGGVDDAGVCVHLCAEPGLRVLEYARLVHGHSRRTNEEMHVFQCGADDSRFEVPRLFGDEADGSAGLWSESRAGSLVLCNLGALARQTQERLAKALTEVMRPFVISTGPESLEELHTSGRLSDSLFHGLKSLVLRLPPLRERPADAVPIFVAAWRRQAHGTSPLLSQEAIDALRHGHWPANVDSVESLARTVQAGFRAGREVGVKDLVSAGFKRARSGRRLRDHKSDVKRYQAEEVNRVWLAHAGNVDAVKAELGVSRATVYRRRRDYRELFGDENAGG